MLAIDLELLTDRLVATRYSDRDAAEWPPEPARLYSALVAALHDDEAPSATERQALEALAELGAPQILASDAHLRRVMTHFVAVNDVDQVGGDFTRVEQAVADAERAHQAARDTLAAATTAGAVTKAQKAADKALTKVKTAQSKLLELNAKLTDGACKIPTKHLAHKILPWERTKKERTFPAVLPHQPLVRYVWPDAVVDDAVSDALSAVAARVARLGHSSSFVRVRVDRSQEPWPPPADDERQLWSPDEEGDRVLRVPLADQLSQLERAFEQHQGDTPGRVLPCASQRYRLGDAVIAGAKTPRTGGRWVAFAFADDQHPPAMAAVAVAAVARGAVLSHAQDPIHPLLSGHDHHGPLTREHLAVVPLAFVEHPHADGQLRGFALVLPADAEPEADQQLLRAIGAWERASAGPRTVELHLAGGRVLRAERVVDPEDALRTLRLSRWDGPAHRWATVTPIALDGECPSFHHGSPGLRRKAQRIAAKLIARAVSRGVVTGDGASLDPADIRVELVFDAPVVGAAYLGDMKPFQRTGHERPRRLVHAVIELPVAVRGPLLIGAGRHHGLGVCVPFNAPSAGGPS